MPFDARFYTNMNTGANLSSTKGGTFTVTENTGAALVSSKNGFDYAMENTGFVLPTRVSVLIPQVAWGAAMTPGEDVVVIEDAADAYAYSYEGDVT